MTIEELIEKLNSYKNYDMNHKLHCIENLILDFFEFDEVPERINKTLQHLEERLGIAADQLDLTIDVIVLELETIKLIKEIS